MADSHHDGGDHGSLFRIYMIIAGVLAVCTATSFVFNSMARSDTISHTMSFVLILIVAIIKATLVGMYFMHLKWDWAKLYFLIVPVFILGVMMMIVFMPDALLGPMADASEELKIAEDVAKR